MTDDERALLAACAADPTNDLPRLVYADFLDDHDQPERAEFVRLSVTAANPTTAAASRVACQARAGTLLAAHRADWERPLMALGVGPAADWSVQLPPVEYDRGLPVGVVLPLDVFVAAGDAILAAAPTVTRLDLTSQFVGDAGVARLAACPHLAEVTALDLTNNQLGPAAAAALAASPYVGRLKSLTLGMNRQLGDDGRSALRASPHFPPDMMLGLSGHTTYRFDDFQRVVDERLRRPGSGPSR